MIWTIISLFLLQSTSTSTLEVDFFGIDRSSGFIMVSLTDKEGKVVVQKKEPVERPGTQTVRFDSLPPGDYALKAFWDANGNGDLDKGFFGEPKEKYGFSNDARGLMGPPDLQDQIFKVNGDTRISVTLK